MKTPPKSILVLASLFTSLFGYAQCALVVTPTATNETCPAACDGRVKLVVSGGTPTYTYTWSDGQNVATAKNLCPGTYTVIVRDAAGCADTTSYVISPATYNAGIAKNNPVCFGDCNGNALATPTGGSAGYTYLWAPGGQTTAGINNLCEGTHTVTVTDSKNCVIVKTVSIVDPSQLITNVSSTNPSCVSCTDGSATVAASGGNKPYDYLWTPGNYNTAKVTGIGSGTYTVCVTDKNGCSSCKTVTVSITTGINTIASSEEINIYPNPASDYVVMERFFPIKATLSLTTVLGQQVYQANWNENELKMIIPTEQFPAGLYLMAFKKSDGSTFTRKILLRKDL